MRINHCSVVIAEWIISGWPNDKGNRAAAKSPGRQKTRQSPLRLTALLGAVVLHCLVP